MKLLLLSDGIPPYIMGGMQRHTLNLVKYLVLGGVEVKLIHFYNEGDSNFSHHEVCQEIFGLEDQPGFQSEMIEFPKPGKVPGHYIRRSYRYSKRVYEKVKDEVNDFDFVYIKGFSGWKLLEQKKHFKPKMGVNFHGYEMFQISPDFKTKLKNQILIPPVQKNLDPSDFIFSYGGGITDLLEKIGVASNRIVSINGAVDAVWFDQASFMKSNQSKRLLFVGRFERRKGIEELNEVLPELLNQYDFQMDFVGPIPEDKQIQNPKISYLGTIQSVEEIKKVYSEHDILIAPSYSEGMPNVIMEAMSQGLAILATDVGATRLLVDEKNGWLMPEMNGEMLKSTLNDLLSSSEDQIHEKRQKSLEKLDENFSWPVVAQKHIDFLKSI
ncbi:MAG: glycosyltransferase family 4 protein [Crocinitomicaceae bacterium]|nr:glycosyltransferase family 4 protein [Crocinitomicaceae bacterium]